MIHSEDEASEKHIDDMRVELCAALAIRRDTSWSAALADARSAGIVRDAEYRYSDRVYEENEQLRAERDAVLTLHRALKAPDGTPYCTSCEGRDANWPCATARAMGVTE